MDQAKPSKNSLKKAAAQQKIIKKLRIPTAIETPKQSTSIKQHEQTNSKKRKQRPVNDDDDEEDDQARIKAKRNSKKSAKEPAEQEVNTDRVYFEFSVNDVSVGRVLIALFRYASPKAVDQFRGFCEKQAYKQNKVHRIVPGFMLQAGDLTGTDIEVPEIDRADCEIGRSRKHRQFGTVSMLVDEKNQIGSQFYITLSEDPLKHLDPQHIVIGQLISGNASLKEIERCKAKSISITDCGIVTDAFLEKMESERKERRELSEQKATVRAANPILCEKCNSAMKYNKRTKKGLRYRCKSCPHAQYIADSNAQATTKTTDEVVSNEAEAESDVDEQSE